MIAIMEKLTIKQEKFVQSLLKGMSQREAYKNSYGKVKASYEELNKRAEDKAIMSAIERKKWLTKVINCDVKVKQEYDNEIKEYDPYMSDRLKALDMLNKMDGVYVTKVNGDINVNKKLEDMI